MRAKVAYDDPRQPRRGRRRAHGLLVLLRRGPPRARQARPGARPGEHGVAEGPALRGPREATSCSVTARPSNIEEFDYIFAREQAASACRSGTRCRTLTLIGHSHLCKSFALNPSTRRRRRCVAQKFELRPGWKYIVSVGSVGQPRDFDTRASYTVYDTETKRLRVQAGRVRREDVGEQDPGVGPRAELRHPPVPRDLSQRRADSPRPSPGSRRRRRG